MTAATTRACPKCNSNVAADTKFCPNCGSAVSGIFSGGGTPQDGTAMLSVEQVDTLYPILQDATLGDYDIYGELGRGGMAAVYLALDLSLNRKVAIKTMLPDLVGKTGMVDRFKREAQTAAALSHPHIIQIFSVKQTKNLVYFVMKYIEGRSLESVIIERGKLDVDLARVILSQVGGALAFAHRKGVVHRDMKPANIMLEEDGWAIVTDFGIAKVQEAQNLTATGTAIGTPHYMSPEQFHNKSVTGASDQYSLGVVAYEMLTGRKPFDGATYAEIITQHLFETVPDIRTVRPDIPENVANTLTRMMAKEASARFPDLDAAVASLGAATTTQGEKARTQMISLAKGGPERKVRMSVPQSPVPAQRRQAEATVVEPANRQGAQAPSKKPAARPEPAKAKSRAGTMIAALLLLAIGGGASWAYFTGQFNRFINKDQNATQQQGAPTNPRQLAANNPATNPVDSQKAALDSAAANAAATAPPVATVNPPADKPPADKPATKTKKSETKSTVASKTGGTKGTSTKTSDTKTADKSTGEKPAADKQAAEKVVTPPEKKVEPPATPAKPTFIEGSIKIGTPTDGAVLYIDGSAVGALKSVAVYPIKSKDGTVKLQIKADKCTPWDTTFTMAAGESHTIGRRPLVCPP